MVAIVVGRNRFDRLIGRKQKGFYGSFIRNSERICCNGMRVEREEVARPLRCAAGRRKVVSIGVRDRRADRGKESVFFVRRCV